METDFNRKISFRPISSQDMDFLYLVYAGTRQEEMASTGWNSEQIEDFLKMQFNAQHSHYQLHFKDASYEIVFLDQVPVGRLYVDRRKDEIRIIDIALLPEFRKKGIGLYLMKNLLAEAGKKNLPLRLHVEYFNPALNFYERLGFKKLEDVGIYFLMEWSPPGA